MIIGVNGKIGSGKDTVGSIIQYLDLCKKADKTDLSYKEFVNSERWVTDWEIKKFAGKLKQTASLLTGIRVEMFEDQEFKMTNLPDEWARLEQSGRSKVWNHMTVRTFLQRLGTEAMRDGLHTNVWVNALFADYKCPECNSVPGQVCFGHRNPNWIITDMRFPNEMEAVVAKGGITIRVVRSFNHKMGSKETGTLDLTPLHPSETALDGHTMHYEIINDGTIDDLIEKVREILTKQGIL